MMESPKICLICCDHVYQTSVPFFRKVLMVSIKPGRLKNDNFTVTPGMNIHVSCRNFLQETKDFMRRV